MITANELSKKYATDVSGRYVLNNVSFELPDKGICFVLGKSGSGKSTLLNILSGIISDFEGRVLIDGQDISGLSESGWDHFRNQYFGIVFQDFNLIEEATVYDNLTLPLLVKKSSSSEINDAVSSALEFVGLSEYKNQLVCRLSGGQKQRIAIARALVKKPKIVIADEPTGNLDSNTSKTVFELLKKVSENCLVIVATHDVIAAAKYSDYILNIIDGSISLQKNKSKSYELYDDDSNSIVLRTTNLDDVAVNVCYYFNHDSGEAGGNRVLTIRETINDTAEESESRKTPGAESDNAVYENKPLSRKSAFSLAVKSLLKKPVRNLILAVLVSILLLFQLFSIALSNYDTSIPLAFYNDEYHHPFLTVVSHYEYTDSFFQPQVKTVSSGYPFLLKLKNVFTEESILPVDSGNSLRKGELFFDWIRVAVLPDHYERRDMLVCGRMPAKFDEIVITDYLAEILGIPTDLTDTDIKLNDKSSMTVVGISKTDYAEYGIIEKTRLYKTNEYSEYKLDYEYRLSFVCDDYCEHEKNSSRSIYLERSDIAYCSWESRLIDSFMPYGTVSFVNSDNLVCGSLPAKENDILISSDLAQRLEVDTANFAPFSDSFIDLYASKYNDYYTDSINMHDYFPDGFSVVGVFGSVQEWCDDCPDVLVTQCIFDEIKKDYYGLYYFDEYYVINDYSGKEVFDRMRENELSWTEVSAERIYTFAESLKPLMVYINLSAVLSFGCIVLTFILLISYSIKDQSKLLGIMRAVGFTKRDINRIFIIESIVTGALGVMLSVLSFEAIRRYANNSYALSLPENPFDLLVFSPAVIVVALIVSIIICLLSAIVPIYRLARKKPFDLIHFG